MNFIKRGSVWAVLAIVAALVIGCSNEAPPKVSVSADTMFTSVEHVEAAMNYASQVLGGTGVESEGSQALIASLKAQGMPEAGSYSPSHVTAYSQGDLINKLKLVITYYAVAVANGEVSVEESGIRLSGMMRALETALAVEPMQLPLTIDF